MDDLEKYINDQRDAFDDDKPREEVWDKLQHRLYEDSLKTKKPALIRHLSLSAKKWVAVAAVLLFCVSFAAFIRTYQVKKEIAHTAIPADLRDAQAYYETRIRTKIERIKLLETKDRRDSSLWHLFGERDPEYDRLQKALHENPGNPHVRAAFVEYYRSRLEVLKRIEQHLEK